MNEPLFDHEKLDVYRLAIDYVAYSFSIASGLTGQNRHARDQWIRAAQSIPLNIAEGNGKHRLKDRSRFFDIARGSALECAAIHDVLSVCLAMLTKLVARNESVSETAAVYKEGLEQEQEHEHEGARQ